MLPTVSRPRMERGRRGTSPATGRFRQNTRAAWRTWKGRCYIFRARRSAFIYVLLAGSATHSAERPCECDDPMEKSRGASARSPISDSGRRRFRHTALIAARAHAAVDCAGRSRMQHRGRRSKFRSRPDSLRRTIACHSSGARSASKSGGSNRMRWGCL